MVGLEDKSWIRQSTGSQRPREYRRFPQSSVEYTGDFWGTQPWRQVLPAPRSRPMLACGYLVDHPALLHVWSRLARGQHPCGLHLSLLLCARYSLSLNDDCNHNDNIATFILVCPWQKMQDYQLGAFEHRALAKPVAPGA